MCIAAAWRGGGGMHLIKRQFSQKLHIGESVR
jgi:hypothetical protein